MVYLGLIGEALAIEKVYIMQISTDLSSRTASIVGPYYARYRKKLLPYYLQRAYMGLQFTEEICQTFYEHACMEIKHHADIRDALNKGPLQRHPTAAPFHLLRRLRLRLSFEDYHKMQSRAEPIYQEGVATKDDYASQVDRVSYCAELKQVGRLEITIVLDAILFMAGEKYEEMLVPFIYQLKKKGA
jgi:hypothetical protein